MVLRDNTLLTLAAVLLSLMEFLLRVTMPYRDRFFYRKMFGPHLAFGLNPFKLMSEARNRGLRSETENLENVSDAVFIFCGIFWAPQISCSLDGISVVTVPQLF